ncbi:hypothetical protein OG352_34380 [Streptomyces sp. NBC_01485]|uniref:hypothetical protein n=1 Tax=Streptomyces sp. NBC_01485 TaxID=2903884 RepID=UPI002E33D953|nr:hypothetical protein [Streptomyces sp. NBC_01485]
MLPAPERRTRAATDTDRAPVAVGDVPATSVQLQLMERTAPQPHLQATSQQARIVRVQKGSGSPSSDSVYPDLRPGCAAEPKWDGYRAQLAVYAGGRVLLRSRRGTDTMTASFPEIRAAALAQLPENTGLDGVM